jgi:hypothetical protein
MKYIKKYENINDYKPGDIIIAKYDYITFNGKKGEANLLLVIKDFSHYYNSKTVKVYACYQYRDNEEDTIYVKKKDIIKKVTKEEADKLVKEMEIRNDAKKYNL